MLDLLTWAEHEFKLSKADDKGITERDHLEQVERQIGHTPQGLENPTDFPYLLQHVWSAFLSLSSGRTVGMSANPLTYQDISAWISLTNNYLSPHDIEVIKALDNLYLKVLNG